MKNNGVAGKCREALSFAQKQVALFLRNRLCTDRVLHRREFKR